MEKVILPHNIEAEQAVLGAMLISDGAIRKALDKLEPMDFYRSEHKTVYEAMQTMEQKRIPIDIVSLTEHLVNNNLMDNISDPTLVARLSNAVPTAANAEYYINLVKEKAVYRRLWYDFNELSGLIFAPENEPDDIVEEARLRMNRITENSRSTEMRPASDIVSETLERLEKCENYGLLTYMQDINERIRGFKPGRMYVIAGRAHMGKTAVALELIRQMAVYRRYKTLFFNLEMEDIQLMERLICSDAGQNFKKVLGRTKYEELNDEAWEELMKSSAKFYETKLHICDHVFSIEKIYSIVRKMKNNNQVDIVFIDYLQLIDTKKNFGNNQERVQYISRKIKLMAKELQLPIVVMAQLNRDIEKREDKRPVMADLRDSGAIEQDADVIMMLYRDDYYNADKPEKDNITEIYIRKNREAGASYEPIKLLWDEEKSQFRNIHNNEPDPSRMTKAQYRAYEAMERAKRAKMEQATLMNDDDYTQENDY